LAESDLGFLLEVRNHATTRERLHHAAEFTFDETVHWFHTQRPKWWIIRDADGAPVGYLRSSDQDPQSYSLAIGCDIHPERRRQGFARAAFEQLLDDLFAGGWHRVWLEVLPDNEPARALYHSLGFQEEGRKRQAVHREDGWRDSIIMSLLKPDWTTGRHLKVITTYLGDRRTPPHCAREVQQLLRFSVEKERTVDPGAPLDTLLVYNKFPDDERVSDPEAVRLAEEYLLGLDGLATNRGVLRVLVRDNVGLSFGGYSDAFERFERDYDYWLFTEDDQVMARDGYLATAIEQLQMDRTIGFVALVGVSREPWYPTHCHGGVGCTQRRILRRVCEANCRPDQARGVLPFFVGKGYDQQEHRGEIPFTNMIANLGYQLVDLSIDEVTIGWGQRGRRTHLMIPWTEACLLEPTGAT
jgi:RimJ/RimL family protein N-acetyltransferase